MQQSEAKEAFWVFQQLRAVLNKEGISHEESIQARVNLWDQVKLLRDHVDEYRWSG